MFNRKLTSGVKRKVFLGFLALAVILFFSSIISIFEFSKMNKTLSGLVSDNIKSINAARTLMIQSEDYNSMLLNNLNKTDGEFAEFKAVESDDFVASFNNLKKSFTTNKERQCADSVLFAYTAYMQVVREAQEVWLMGNEEDWFFSRLQPFYIQLRSYIQKLTQVSQEALVQNSKDVQDTFYRSSMPAVASVAVGFIMVILFNYFLNFYVINPLLRITKGIKNFKLYGKNYDVKLDSDDEIAELNDSVKDLIESNKVRNRK